MRLNAVLSTCLCLLGVPAAAQTASGCAAPEAKQINDALRNAKALTLRAAVAVGPTDIYERWFGPYDAQNAEAVRATLKSVVQAIRSGAVTLICEPASTDACAGGAYAFVYPTQPYDIHFCPSFFT